MAAWGALPKYAGRSRFKAWLFGIAVHKAADAGRARGRIQAEEWTELDNQFAAGPDPFAASDLKQSVRALWPG